MKLNTAKLTSAVSRFLFPKDTEVSAASLQELLRRSSRRYMPLLGWPGIVAIGILVMCPPLFFSGLRPMQERLSLYQRVDNSLHGQTTRGGQDYQQVTTPDEELDEFYKHFPSEKESPRWLGKLVEVASKHGLSLNHGEYMTTRDNYGQLIRFKITLPVQGKYPQIRRFLDALNSEMPMMALENVQFERKDPLDTKVQVKISFLLYMVKES